VTVKKQASFELPNSPASVQSDPEAVVASDIESPAKQPVEQQNTENESFVEDKQDVVTILILISPFCNLKHGQTIIIMSVIEFHPYCKLQVILLNNDYIIDITEKVGARNMNVTIG
jgi:hypothetical protein